MTTIIVVVLISVVLLDIYVWVGQIIKKNETIFDLEQKLVEKRNKFNEIYHKYGKEKKENQEMRERNEREIVGAIDLYEGEARRYIELKEQMFIILDVVDQMDLESTKIFEMLDKHQAARKRKNQPEE